MPDEQAHQRSPRRLRDRARSPASRPWLRERRCSSCSGADRPCPRQSPHRERRRERPLPTHPARPRSHRPWRVCRGKLGGDAEAHNAGDILGAGAPSPLLAAALEKRLDGDARRGRALPHLSGRRSYGPTGSSCRRRARRCRGAACRRPERHRCAGGRPLHGRLRRPRRRAGSRPSRYWQPSGKRKASNLLDGVFQALSQGRQGRQRLRRDRDKSGASRVEPSAAQHRGMLNGREIAVPWQLAAPRGKSEQQLASVPPLVKITSSGAAPTSSATLIRAASIAARAALPSSCTEDGLPIEIKRATSASRTSGRSGAVAL